MIHNRSVMGFTAICVLFASPIVACGGQDIDDGNRGNEVGTTGGTGGAAVSSSGHLFYCGSEQCDSRTEYCGWYDTQGGCLNEYSDVIGVLRCTPFPSECVASPSCECLHSGCNGDYFSFGGPCSEQNGEIRNCNYLGC